VIPFSPCLHGGRIINLSTSIIGHYLPTHGIYVATKAAVAVAGMIISR